MKNTRKKLDLHRETIRPLALASLAAIGGGARTKVVCTYTEACPTTTADSATCYTNNC